MWLANKKKSLSRMKKQNKCVSKPIRTKKPKIKYYEDSLSLEKNKLFIETRNLIENVTEMFNIIENKTSNDKRNFSKNDIEKLAQQFLRRIGF